MDVNPVLDGLNKSMLVAVSSLLAFQEPITHRMFHRCQRSKSV